MDNSGPIELFILGQVAHILHTFKVDFGLILALFRVKREWKYDFWDHNFHMPESTSDMPVNYVS